MADKSGSIIFEEGVDVLVTSVDETGGSDTEPASYIVGRGQGEGVTTPPLTVSTQAAPFRNEAYLDARDMKTEAGVQVATDGALAEQAWEDAIAVDVTEDRYEAWTHYGPGDLVRVIAPSRGIDATGIIVAMTVSEEGEVVRTKLDLNAPRTDELLKLKSRANATARSLGVTNRQGQGQLLNLLQGRACRHLQAVAHLAVDLHHDGDLLGGGEGRVPGRPGLLVQRPLPAQALP